MHQLWDLAHITCLLWILYIIWPKNTAVSRLPDLHRFSPGLHGSEGWHSWLSFKILITLLQLRSSMSSKNVIINMTNQENTNIYIFFLDLFKIKLGICSETTHWERDDAFAWEIIYCESFTDLHNKLLFIHSSWFFCSESMCSFSLLTTGIIIWLKLMTTLQCSLLWNWLKMFLKILSTAKHIFF